MSHKIEVADDGRATFVAVKDAGWHELGTVVEETLSVGAALKLAHLDDLEYHLEPIAVPVGDPPEFVFGGNYRAVVRRNPFERERWEVIGAGMTTDYTLHTPEEAFGFGENIIDAGQPLAALGSIRGGKRAFAAFRADDITIGGVDTVRMFVNVLTSFDSSASTVVRASGIRVECDNTFTAVMGEASAPTYKVRHVGAGLDGRVADARAALQIGYAGMEAFQREAEAFLDVAVSDSQFEKIVEALLPISAGAAQGTLTRAYESRGQVARLWDGDSLKGIRGTAWGALNAWTEWLDWTAGTYADDNARMVAQITPGSGMDKRRIAGAKTVAKMAKVTIPA